MAGEVAVTDRGRTAVLVAWLALLVGCCGAVLASLGIVVTVRLLCDRDWERGPVGAVVCAALSRTPAVDIGFVALGLGAAAAAGVALVAGVVGVTRRRGLFPRLGAAWAAASAVVFLVASVWYRAGLTDFAPLGPLVLLGQTLVAGAVLGVWLAATLLIAAVASVVALVRRG